MRTTTMRTTRHTRRPLAALLGLCWALMGLLGMGGGAGAQSYTSTAASFSGTNNAGNFGNALSLLGASISLTEPGGQDVQSNVLPWWVSARVRIPATNDTFQGIASQKVDAGGGLWWLGVTSAGHAEYSISPTAAVSMNLIGANNICDGAWHTLVVQNIPGGVSTLYVDGASAATATDTPTLGAYSSPQTLVGNIVTLTTYLTGQVDELAFGTGFAASNNPSVPYTPATPGIKALYHFNTGPTAAIANVVCAGNSLTYGDTLDARQPGTNRATQSYPAQLAGLLGPAWAVSNQGHGGQDILELGDPTWAGAVVASGGGYVSAVDALYNSAADSNTLVFFEGTNSIAQIVRPATLGGGYPGHSGPDALTSTLSAGSVANTVYAQLVAYCRARKALHPWKIVVGTTPYYYLAPDLSNVTTASTLVDPALPAFVDQVRQQYNALVRANWPSFADKLDDLASLPPFASAADCAGDTLNQASTGLWYYKDGVHDTPLGYGIDAASFGRLLLSPPPYNAFPVFAGDVSAALAAVGLTPSTPAATASQVAAVPANTTAAIIASVPFRRIYSYTSGPTDYNPATRLGHTYDPDAWTTIRNQYTLTIASGVTTARQPSN